MTLGRKVRLFLRQKKKCVIFCFLCVCYCFCKKQMWFKIVSTKRAFKTFSLARGLPGQARAGPGARHRVCPWPPGKAWGLPVASWQGPGPARGPPVRPGACVVAPQRSKGLQKKATKKGHQGCLRKRFWAF